MMTFPNNAPEDYGYLEAPRDHYLEVADLRKSYGEISVLEGISFGIERGKCLALLGPSGCGKSTLLNILAGLIPSTSGRVTLDYGVIEDRGAGLVYSPQQRRFSMVFQDVSLWPHMTVEENVAFGLAYLRLGRAQAEARVKKVLEMVGMHEMRERFPATLSGGQQQRVAIARAIVVEPAVLLMDEPLTALDTQLREMLRDEIATLIRRLGITTVYVTHDHTEAMTVADEIAVMNKGRIEQIASPDEISRYPATTFVASFLGCASHFPFSFEIESLRDATGEKVFPAPPTGRERGHLLVRKDQVRIFPVAEAEEFFGDGTVRWKAVCIKNSFNGATHEVHARTRKGEIFRALSPEPIALDREVYVQFDPHQVILVEK